MKIEYLDRINAKAKVEVKVSAKVAHILEEDKEYFKPLSKEEIENLSKRKQNKYISIYRNFVIFWSLMPSRIFLIGSFL